MRLARRDGAVQVEGRQHSGEGAKAKSCSLAGQPQSDYNDDVAVANVGLLCAEEAVREHITEEHCLTTPSHSFDQKISC